MAAVSALCLALLATPSTSTATTSTSTSTSTALAPAVELVTLAPGDALYSLWGHSAIRVVERAPRRDIAYNFGSIDFSGSVWAKMLTGHVEAFVVAAPYHRMARYYRDEDRSIVRRPLNLAPGQARALADALAARVASESRSYRYHHFDDNCSTQVADMIDAALAGTLSATASAPADSTLRALALAPLRGRPWLYVTVDTLLSEAVDRPISAWSTRFLPSRLDALVDAARGANGAPLAAPPTIDFVGADAAERAPWTWPWLKAYLLFVVPLLALFLRFERLAAVLWTALAGLSGVLLTLAWVGTTYDFLAGNWNLLVFPPTHLAALFVLLRSRLLSRSGVRLALRLYAGAHVMVLAGLVGAEISGLVRQAIDPMIGLALGPAIALLARPPRRDGGRGATNPLGPR